MVGCLIFCFYFLREHIWSYPRCYQSHDSSRALLPSAYQFRSQHYTRTLYNDYFGSTSNRSMESWFLEALRSLYFQFYGEFSTREVRQRPYRMVALLWRIHPHRITLTSTLSQYLRGYYPHRSCRVYW